MSATIESVTMVWRLDPPVDVERFYDRATRGNIRVHIVERIEYTETDREDYWSVKGQPLTTKGNIKGGIDYRFVSDKAMDELRSLVLS